ncbi:hypothetical protein [Methylobacterium sp. CM6257]
MDVRFGIFALGSGLSQINPTQNAERMDQRSAKGRKPRASFR